MGFTSLEDQIGDARLGKSIKDPLNKIQSRIKLKETKQVFV